MKERIPGYAAEWGKMQAELAELSTRSTHVVAEHVGHHINRDDPEFIVRVVRDMVDDLRRGERPR